MNVNWFQKWLNISTVVYLYVLTLCTMTFCLHLKLHLNFKNQFLGFYLEIHRWIWCAIVLKIPKKEILHERNTIGEFLASWIFWLKGVRKSTDDISLWYFLEFGFDFLCCKSFKLIGCQSFLISQLFFF